MYGALQNGISRYFNRLGHAGRGLCQVTAEAFPKTGKDVLKKSVTAAALVGATALTMPEHSWQMAGIQALGFGGYLAGLGINQLKYNHHKLSVFPVAAGMIAVHKALLGGWSYAVMAGMAASRAGVFATLPEGEEYNKIRRNIGYGFAGAGIPAMVALGFIDSPWSLLNAGAMICGTVADAVPSSEENKAADKTHYARILRLAGNTLNAVYSGVYTQSTAAVIFDSVATYNLGTAIKKYDMPVADSRTHAPVTKKSSLAQYSNLIFLNERPRDLTPDDLYRLQQWQVKTHGASGPELQKRLAQPA